VLVSARGIVKGYRTQAGYVPVLNDLDLEVREGEMVAVVGASGVGKSTLLHVLGTLDRPEAGTVEIGGVSCLDFSEGELRTFRNRTIGFVFQFHHLLPEFSALENVTIPLRIARVGREEARERARAILEELGLKDRLEHTPGELSGGEQQRVAVARAIVGAPRLLLADEPTGNLDRLTGDRLKDVLQRLNRNRGITVVVVTHDEGLAAASDRVFRLEGGRLVAIGAPEAPSARGFLG
jgi:lipoprotein-releasing system ATP-binding protein